MKLLVLQHARAEHPGSLRTLLQEDGHEWVPVQLDEGEDLPSLDGFDGLWVLGGPMDVWEEESYPWLKAEKAFIHEAVCVRGMPYLGLCLGHQLLAEALGGQCAPAAEPEIGVMDVCLTETGASGILFDGLPERFPCLQWHSAEVIALPGGAVCLATSAACSIQAMQWQTRAYSVQFHLEVEPDTFQNWRGIPAYENALHSALGPAGAAQFERACDENMHKFNEMAERFYINWLQTSARV